MKATLQMALEALNTNRVMAKDSDGNYTREITPKLIVEAITAIKEALAQPERGLKPRCFADFQPNHEHDRKCQWCAVETECKTGMAQPEHEPVAYVIEAKSLGAVALKLTKELPVGTQLYTTPPQRTWVGLDDTDLAVCDTDGVMLAKYWERVLKEKNA